MCDKIYMLAPLLANIIYLYYIRILDIELTLIMRMKYYTGKWEHAKQVDTRIMRMKCQRTHYLVSSIFDGIYIHTYIILYIIKSVCTEFVHYFETISYVSSIIQFDDVCNEIYILPQFWQTKYICFICLSWT
jgi:hypothetical protein